MAFAVRLAREEDGPALQGIERRAGERFRDVGLSVVADDDPGSVEELAAYARDRRSWVAVDDDGEPAGYVLVDCVDGDAHIEQMSVVPEHQGSGAGRALLGQVRRWALERGLPAITLTTYAEVPWNRPLYEHWGFVVVPEDTIGPELRAVRAAERARGLDVAERVCMRREVGL